MSTRTYSQVYSDIEALVGNALAAEETARVKLFINRRARKAYDETPYWPSFLVAAEERGVKTGGLLPLTEDSLSEIDTVLRIHAKDPYKSTYATEYAQFHRKGDGVLVTGWADNSSSYVRVSGDITPDISAVAKMPYMGSEAAGYDSAELGATVAGTYNSYTGEPDDYPRLVLSFIDSLTPYWYLHYYLNTSQFDALPYLANPAAGWTSGSAFPDPEDATFDPAGGTAAGVPTLTSYAGTVFVTYKKALTDTYGTGDGETTTVPLEWADYIVQGAYADWLRSEGQQEKALVAEAEAEDYLQKQLDKISRQNGDQVTTRFVTYGNTQYRT